MSLTPTTWIEPTEYTFTVEPRETVTVGTDVFITIRYEKGDYRQYGPTLELLDSPEEHPSQPKPLAKYDVRDGNARFHVWPTSVGCYTYRLRPFSEREGGDPIEIYAIDQEQEIGLVSIYRRFKERNKSSTQF